jgi:tRNA pseudouridine38-40 synthase
MPVWRLDLAYDGSGYHGYAHQNGLRTVQGELENALATALGGKVETAVAGRTDAGVHARGQVVSFEHPDLDPDVLARSINGIVGSEISVLSISKAPDGFNARFSASWRRYRYVIDQGPAPDPMRRHEAWFPGRTLDVAAMQEVAVELIGERDFSSFCRTVEDKSNVRRVESAQWIADGPFLEFWIKANAFCHQMVRSLVGFSYDVGRGFSPADSVSDVIEARDRAVVATVAPPHGLTLWEVGY